jgi:hypothetical protein
MARENLIQSFGLFWKREDVFWGGGKTKGALLGKPRDARSTGPIDFRYQIGIYLLYSGHDLVYVGQAGVGRSALYARLLQHRRDHLSERWDRFSWFGTRRVLEKSGELAARHKRKSPSLKITLNHFEAVLIAAAEPPLNLKGGSFGSGTRQYIQHRDPRLGMTEKAMLRELCKKNGVDWKKPDGS